METKKAYSTIDPYSKLSQRAKKIILDAEKEHKLYLGDLIKEYGILFTLRLLKLSTKCKKHRQETKMVEMFWPEMVKRSTREEDKNLFEKKFDEYIRKVEEAGFSLCRKYEPFIDEDTGENYVIKRHYIYFLKKC